jgi:hypothetical protein
VCWYCYYIPLLIDKPIAPNSTATTLQPPTVAESLPVFKEDLEKNKNVKYQQSNSYLLLALTFFCTLEPAIGGVTLDYLA